MRWLSSLSLSIKLPLVLTLIVAGVAGAMGAALIYRDREQLRDDLKEKALLLARSVAVVGAEPILRGDSWTLYKALRQLTQGPDGTRSPAIINAMVLDPQSRVLAHIQPEEFPVGLPVALPDSADGRMMRTALANKNATIIDGNGYVEAMAPVLVGSTSIGLVSVRLSSVELERKAADALATVIALYAGVVLIASLIGLFWSIRTLKPLQTLADSMEELGRGVVPVLPVSRGDEIGKLIVSFNQMAAEVEEKRRLTGELAANEKVIALGRIAAGVAHEVNNPLAGMLNCLSTLRATSNDPKLVERYLPMIEKGLQKIDALVKDLLIELRVEDSHEIADAGSLEDVRDLIAVEIEPHLISFSWDSRLQSGVLVNRSKVQQILLNLLRNSIQAMPTGGRLECRIWNNDMALFFEVEDTGKGISKEDLPRIFDPFFTTRPAGTGLGLWIVLRLVQSMRGAVSVQSVPNQGTTFHISIPRESPRDE